MGFFLPALMMIYVAGYEVIVATIPSYLHTELDNSASLSQN